MTIDLHTVVEAFGFISRHLPLTLFLPAVTMLIGIILGSIIAIIRLRSNKYINAVLAVFVSFVRAVPAIVQVLLCITACPIFWRRCSAFLQAAW